METYPRVIRMTTTPKIWGVSLVRPLDVVLARFLEGGEDAVGDPCPRRNHPPPALGLEAGPLGLVQDHQGVVA